MYSMVMMMTMASGGDVAMFGGRGGCGGRVVVASSCGCGGGHAWGARRSAGCWGNGGGCWGNGNGCFGGNSCRGGLFGGKHNRGAGCCGVTNCCQPTNCCGATVSCCGTVGGTVVMPAAPATPAQDMPAPAEMPKKKDN